MVRTKAEKNRMILSNQGLVCYIAKRTRLELPLEDKMQEGTLGLIQAVERFNPARGVRFGTYATWWIRQAIERMARRYHRGYQLPVQADLQMRKLKRVRRHLWGELRRPPTIEEVAQRAGIPKKRAHLLEHLRNDLPAVEEECPRLMSSAKPPWTVRIKGPEDDAVVEELQVQVGELLSSLKPKHRYVVVRRLGLDGSRGGTLQQVADELRLSRERIRQIWNVAIERLRRNARREGLEAFL